MNGTHLTSQSAVWLIDYDLSMNKPRRQFYREVKRLMNERGLMGALSTYSVIVVNDRELAIAVFDLATRYGRAHLYRAVQVA